VAAAVVVRLVAALQIAGGPLPRIHELFRDSDNAFFHQWGQRVAAGDLLQREAWFPRCEWMRATARDAVRADPTLPARLGIGEAGDQGDEVAWKLWERWLGGAQFFQEPLYPYLVGLTYRLAGPDVWAVLVWQLALGAAGVLVVWSLARRLGSESAALAAAILAVLAPIPLTYELTLLRDAPVAYATLALALAMAWAPDGRPWRWFALGAAFGAAVLLKQSFWFFPALFGLWRLAAIRPPLRDRARAAGLTAAGMAVALAPVAIRNALVDVPWLALNGSAPAMLPLFHTASAQPIGSVDFTGLGEMLASSGGGFVEAIAAAARTHASPLGLVLLEARKLLYAWHGYEAENNVDFYVFAEASPLLGALPVTIVVLLPLACIGAAAARARAAPLLVAILASLPTLILAAALSRYRAAITAALLPLAGLGCVELARWVSTRRWKLVASATAAVALYVAWASSAPPGEGREARAYRYREIATRALEGRHASYASLLFKASLRLAPDPTTEGNLGVALLAARDAEAAVPHLEAASRALRTPRTYELLGAALAEAGRVDEARAALRECLALDPLRPGARRLLARLEGGAAPPPPRR
jgi:hypothetical protein